MDTQNQLPPPALAGLTEIAPLTNPIIISDLHLAPTKPKTIMAFVRFMKTIAPRYPELVILGDLFDYWIGDDASYTMAAVADALPEGSTTVGAEMNVTHIKPSGLGAEIAATAVLVGVEGRKLTFNVGARDGEGMIGEGVHIRYTVDRHRFMEKAGR